MSNSCGRMPNIILSNGIHTHGEGNLDVLGTILKNKGLKVLDVRLPKRNAFTARFSAKADSLALSQVSDHGDVIIGHSFGCLRAAKASETVMYGKIICIAPAMPKDYAWTNPHRVVNFYSDDDKALKASKLLLFHPFGGGSAGLEGFSDPSVTNIHMNSLDHSDFFHDGHVNVIAEYVEEVVERLRSTG